jgi:putative ubiquitin-RnfH superfamily antitoxin RatB of RatAB toxin-antitoxin module
MKIRVEVVYALADAQTIIEVELEQGARVADALSASRIAEQLSGGLPANFRLGIWGTPASPETGLRDRDRVEIYRELVADPKQARRQRARQQRGTSTRR